MGRPSVCVIAAGGLTPDLTDQTLQDYQVLCVNTEAEALAASDAEAFLWLTSAGKLRPQALEECLWALQSADWVTWEDTGAAPAPSMRDVAGPLGLSRKAFEWPEPKPGGTVRRLPWPCITGPAQRHAEESIPMTDGPAAPVATNAGGRWTRRLLNAAEYVNRRLGRVLFDLSSYKRFDPDAAYANGILLRPLRYPVTAMQDRRRVAAVVGSLGESEAQRALLRVVEQIDRSALEVIVIAERSDGKAWKKKWLQCSDFLMEAGAIASPDDRERLILSVALNWQIDALLVADSPAAYRVLPAIKQAMPGLRTADVVADLDAHELTDNTIDSLDFRIARLRAVQKGLEGMALDGQQVRWIPYGVEPAQRYEGEADVTAIGFRGRLDKASGASLLPALADELERLNPSARTCWVIAGTGPLEARLRQSFSKRDATFVGDREPAADLLVVPSEGAAGDWASLEALRRGAPVVAFHTDAREEIVTDGCGVLVTGGHDGEFRLAAAVAELIGDKGAMTAMAEAARNRAALHYCGDNEVAQCRAFLAEFLTEPSGKIQLLSS